MPGNFKRARVSQLPSGADFQKVRESTTSLITAVGALGDEFAKLQAGGLALGVNTPGRLKLLKFRMPDDAPWQSLPVYSANWLGGTAQILMTPGGEVRMRGVRVANPGGAYGGSAPVGVLVETIPEGYRPAADLQAPVSLALAAGGYGWGVLTLTASSGLCQIAGGSGNFASWSWDCLMWLATAAAPPHQFAGGVWPMRVSHDLEGPCRGLIPLGFRLLGQSGQNVGAGAPVVDWQDLGDGTLRINGVWGLQWGKSYELLCYLTPEEE